MKKILFIFISLLTLVAAGKDILRNKDFKQDSNGKLRDWELRGGASAFKRNTDGSIILTRKDGVQVMLIQNRLILTPGKEYVFLADVKAPRGTDFMIYFEEYDSKGKLHNPGTKFRSGGKGIWEKAVVNFTPENKKFRNRLLIRLLNKNSSLEIKNLQIIPAEEYQNHGIYEMQSSGTRRVLINGNFERGASNWQLAGKARYRRTTGNFGNIGMHLPGKGDGAVQSRVMLNASKVWRLTFFAGAAAKKNAKFKFIAINQNSKKRFNDRLLTAKPGVYQRFEFRFTPDGKGEQPISFIMHNESGEPLWVDEIYLDEFIEENPVQIKLTSPAYRNRIYASLPIKKIAGSVVCQDAVAFEIKFNGTTLNIKGSTVFFEFPAKSLKTGKYPLTVTAFDHNKKVIGKNKTVIQKMAPCKNEVIIDNQNNIRVAGKRIFPISLYLSGPDIIKYAAGRHGANVMRDQGWISSEKAAWELLEKARKNNLFLEMRISGIHEFRDVPDFRNRWKKHISKILSPRVINHPSLFVYEYGDEGIGNDVPDRIYKEALEVMDEIDPYHPVVKTESPRGTVVEYLKKHSRYTHIHGVDIYPIPASLCHSALDDKSLASVGRYAMLYKEATGGRKPYHLVLQAYEWRKNSGYPSEKQQRYMNFDALLHGIKFLSYYNDGTENQAYYNIFLKCMKEVYHWERIINEGVMLTKFKSSVKNVLAAGYQLEGKNYYVILNRSDRKVRYTINGLKKDAIELSSKRKIRNGTSLVLDSWDTLLLSENGTLPAGAWKLTAFHPEKEKNIGNLFAEKERVMAKLGKAYWIWYPGETRKKGSKIVAVKQFTLDEIPEKAVLFTTTDDKFTAKINGKNILSGAQWTKIYSAEIAKYLKKGENTLEITGINEASGCCMIAQLELKYKKNGTTVHVVTDNSWQITNSQKQISPAHVLGKFGDGVRTWMRIK